MLYIWNNPPPFCFFKIGCNIDRFFVCPKKHSKNIFIIKNLTIPLKFSILLTLNIFQKFPIATDKGSVSREKKLLLGVYLTPRGRGYTHIRNMTQGGAKKWWSLKNYETSQGNIWRMGSFYFFSYKMHINNNYDSQCCHCQGAEI
jgi:hypothetical protein